MGIYTTRDLIWDSSIKHIVSGDPFTARDLVDDADVAFSPQEVTQVLESLARFGWVEEQTDLDESEWHPSVELQADKLPSLDISGGQTEKETKYDSPSAGESNDDSTDGENSTEMSDTSDGDTADAKTLEDIRKPSDLSEGQVYVGTVDRLTPNAVIELERGHVNLGPISEDAEGEVIRFKSSGSAWGRCLDEEYTYSGYSPQSDGSTTSTSQSRDRRYSGKTSSGSRQQSGATGGTLSGKDPENKNKLLTGRQ